MKNYKNNYIYNINIIIYISIKMYNTKYICTYNENNVFNDEDNISEYDKEFIRDALYRQDILNIFQIDEFDQELLNEKILVLFEKIKHSEQLNPLIQKLAEFFMSDDLILGFMVLFTFDYLYVSHPCICEFLELEKISEINFKKLNSIIL